jgi:hypothetical protein
VNRTTYRTRQAGGVPGWGPAPGWGQPFPGWSPLVDHRPLPLPMAGSVARWWWPTLALASFGAVVGFVLGHDHPTPGLSTRGLITIALAAVVVVLLTLHRTAGPGALARAVAEYAVVALLTALLALAGGVDQQPTSSTGSSARTAGWLVDLWRQADAKTNHPTEPPHATTPKGQAMPPSPAVASTSTRRLL